MEVDSIKAVILAGSSGDKINQNYQHIPKPMVSVIGIPFLEYNIRLLKEKGVNDIIICISHLGDKIKSYFGDGRRWRVNLIYSEEDISLGTAGAIKKAEKYIDKIFLLIYGNVYAKLDFDNLIDFHNKKDSLITLVVKNPEKDNEENLIKVNLEKGTLDFNEQNSSSKELINTGIYLMNKEVLSFIPPGKNFSIRKDLLPLLSQKREIFTYNYEGLFVNIDKIESYEKFKEEIFSSILVKEDFSIMEAMHKIIKNKIDILLVVDAENKLLGVVNDRIIKENIMKGGNITDNLKDIMVQNPVVATTEDSSSKIEELLLAGIRYLPILDKEGRAKMVEVRSEKIKVENFPIIRGKVPLRISFAGGGTDLNYFFEKHGGAVLGATIDKYCYATLIKRADNKIIIDSDITPEEDIVVKSIQDLKYDGRFDLIKAVIKLMNPEFGFELYLHNDVPPGRGLGSSASLAVLIISLLDQIQETNYDAYKIAEIAYRAERDELKIKGGWQDQYAAVTGGFNFMEFDETKNLIYPLRLKEETINELNHHLILCYMGKSHSSGEVHTKQEESFKEKEEEAIISLKNLKRMALEMRDALLTNKIRIFGRLLNDSWKYKKSISNSISNEKIDELYEFALSNGSEGGKLLGAGDGGYLLLFCPPQRRNQLINALKNRGNEVLTFNFEFKGAQTWMVKKISNKFI